MSDIPLTKQPSKWRLRWVISKNEMWNILRHPNYLVLLGIPVFMSLVFGIMMGSLQGPDEFIVVVYDEGESSWIAELNQIPEIEWLFVNSEAELLSAVEDDATAGIIIPANFDTAVNSDNPPELTAYINSETSRGRMVRFRQGLTEQVWAIAYDTPPATIDWQEANANEGRFSDFSPEIYITVMFVIVAVTLAVIDIAPQLLLESRQNGVLSLLMASPVELADVLFGQSVATLLSSMVVASAVLLINFQNVVNWPLVIGCIFLLAIVLNGLGLILGIICADKGRCNAYMAVTGILLVVPVWFLIAPLEDLPAIVYWILQLAPTYHFGVALTHLLNESATLNNIIVNISALIAFGVLFYGIVHQFSKRPLTTI